MRIQNYFNLTPFTHNRLFHKFHLEHRDCPDQVKTDTWLLWPNWQGAELLRVLHTFATASVVIVVVILRLRVQISSGAIVSLSFFLKKEGINHFKLHQMHGADSSHFAHPLSQLVNDWSTGRLVDWSTCQRCCTRT
jgi:hypothetical protein